MDPWNHGDTDAVVAFSTNELTALCPITGQPDFYEPTLSYHPGAFLIDAAGETAPLAICRAALALAPTSLP